MRVLLISAFIAVMHCQIACARGKTAETMDVDALYTKGTRHLNSGANAEALAAFDLAVASGSGGGKTQGFLHVNRGLTLARLGRPHEAIAEYEGVLRLQPAHIYALYNNGLSLRRIGRFSEAIQRFQQALQVQPNHADARHDLCALQFELRGSDDVLTSAVRRRLNDALHNCDQCLSLQPQHQLAHVTRGLVLNALQVPPLLTLSNVLIDL